MDIRAGNDVVKKETIYVLGGTRGTIEYYYNRGVKVNLQISPDSVTNKMLSFVDSLIEIKIKFRKHPDKKLEFVTYIRPNFDFVKGKREEIEWYTVKIKSKKPCDIITTPYNRVEKPMFNLCKHPPKHRIAHGGKHIYLGGSMTPR